MRCRWWKDAMRQVHMDFHMPEFPVEAITNFDAEAFAGQLERGRVNMAALFAKCHFGNAFYDTRVGHKHRGLRQDFLREAGAACHRRGIRVLAYYSLCADERAWRENPGWRFVDHEGKTSGGDTFWCVPCMNSPYKDELVLPQLEEIASGYPVDGFWLDIIWPPRRAACYCPHCRRKWRAMGVELTANLPGRERYRLALRTIADYLREIRAMLARVNPDLVICVNSVGGPGVTAEIKELCHIGTWEAQPQPGDWLSQSYAARTARNDPVDTQVMSVRFFHGWGDLTLKPAAQMTTEFAAMIGNGLPAVSGDQVNVDGTLQAPVYDMFRSSFGFVQAREDVLRQAESVRHVAVLLPDDDPELPLDMAVTREGSWGEVAPEWRGAHKLLTESHIQVDCVHTAFAERPLRYPVIVLPEPGEYPDALMPDLREYVRGGGVLVAVGQSLLRNGKFALEDVFGVRFIEPLAASVCHFVPCDAVASRLPAIPHQVCGQAYKVLPAGAEELAALHLPQVERQPGVKEFRHVCSPPRSQRSPYAFATAQRYGKGTAAYVSASVFAIYWQTNHWWLRVFMENLLRHVDPHMPFAIDASGLVEGNLMRAGADLLLNVIHYAPGHQGGPKAISTIERVHPLHEVACRVRAGHVERVVLEPEGREIPFTFKDGVCAFSLPQLEYLAIVRLCGAAGQPVSEGAS